MTLVKRIVYSIKTMEGIYPFCAGITLLLLGIVTLLSSRCHLIYLLILMPRGALPFWLFALLGMLLFFLMGVAAGCLFAVPGCKKHGYYPMFLYVSMIVLTISWYHILFRSLSFFTSCFLLLVILCIQILTVLKTVNHNLLSAVVTAFSSIITLHFLWLNIGILFLN